MSPKPNLQGSPSGAAGGPKGAGPEPWRPGPGPSRPAPAGSPGPRPGAGPAAGAARRGPFARTMVGGMGPLDSPAVAVKPEPRDPPPEAHAPTVPPAEGGEPPAADPQLQVAPFDDVGRGRTMIGMNTAAAVGAVAGGTAARAPRPSPPGSGGVAAQGRTMLGAPGLAAGSGPERPAPAAAAMASYGAGSAAARYDAGEPLADEAGAESPTLPRRRGTAVLLLVGLLALSLLGVAAFLWQSARSAEDVRVSVVSTEQGEAMLFRVLDAPPGARIEFGGQEQPLKAGEARFPLATDSLVVGDNVVVANVLHADGDSLPLRIPLHVDYRIHVDNAPLRSDKPSLDVVVAATAGTRVVLDGVPLELDGQGRGIRSYPVDVVEGGRSGMIDHVVKYRIEPPEGEPVVGELHSEVAVTMLQLDTPGQTAITDAASIQVAGAVAKGTNVTLDGEAVSIHEEGRFLHVLALPEPGRYSPRLMAQAPEKAPLLLTLDILRVDDLAQAAEAFAADDNLTYGQIAQNPTMYKGQRVDFDGRVFNVKTERGRGVLQMLVRDCAKGRQCSLWVTYPATTRISSDSWVRVLGTVQGQQQFRSRSDEIITVPKVSAIFVLPSKP